MELTIKQEPRNNLLKPALIALLFSILVGAGVIILGTNQTPLLLMYYFFGINFIAALDNSKSSISSSLLGLTLFTLMCATNNANGQNGDYRAYNELYMHFFNGGTIENIYGYSTDYGYMVLMNWISATGITYNWFISILAVFSLMLIRSTVSKITTHYSLVLFCYAMFPFFYDVYQFRYFFAYSFVIYALQFIIFEQKKNYLKFATIVIISSLFHSSTLLFLIYILLRLNIKAILKLGFVISALLAAGSLFLNINVVNYIVSILQISKLQTYTSGTLSYKLNPLTSFSIILFIAFFIFILKKIKDYNNDYTTNTVLWLNLINLFILPLLFVSLDFERFIRPILIINYAIIAAYFVKIPFNKRFLLLISLVIVVFFRQLMMMGLSGVIIENNFVLDFLYTIFE